MQRRPTAIARARFSFAALPVALAVAVPVALLLSLGTANAVVIATGDGTGNTEAPADDPGFAHVGEVGTSVVYVGNGWVLSANHVKLSDVRIDGRSHRAIAGSKLRLRNPSLPARPDLAVWKIHPPPALPRLAIRPEPTRVGDFVVLVGRGRNRGEATSWRHFSGWSWGRGNEMRWGTNLVQEVGLFTRLGRTNRTHAFSTDFSSVSPTPYESQAAVGDSGGAAFIKRRGRWELAGILFATTGHTGQPEKTALFGNLTRIAELSIYRRQILDLTSRPACSDGLDDDGDGRIDFPDDSDCAGPRDTFEGLQPE